MPTKPKPKPKRKRLKPRLLVEAERDACDLVGRALFEVLERHKSRLDSRQHVRAVEQERDPLAALRVAIARGAQRAVDTAANARSVLPLEIMRRAALTVHLKHVDKRKPENLHAFLANEQELKAWVIDRMDELVGGGDETPSAKPLPVRAAAEIVATELSDKLDAGRIRNWWRRRGNR